MSYDLYCYHPVKNAPDVDDASEVLALDDNCETVPDGATTEKMERIAQALLDFDSRLERFKPDLEEIARMQNNSIAEVPEKFQHIELNTPEGSLAVQITVFPNNVSITIPYWYHGQEAEAVFRQVTEYAKVIQKTAGYFVYDPQLDLAFDPSTTPFSGQAVYEKTANLLPQEKKSWWKFW